MTNLKGLFPDGKQISKQSDAFWDAVRSMCGMDAFDDAQMFLLCHKIHASLHHFLGINILPKPHRSVHGLSTLHA